MIAGDVGHPGPFAALAKDLLDHGVTAVVPAPSQLPAIDDVAQPDRESARAGAGTDNASVCACLCRGGRSRARANGDRGVERAGDLNRGGSHSKVGIPCLACNAGRGTLTGVTTVMQWLHECRELGAGSREPEAGSRKPEVCTKTFPRKRLPVVVRRRLPAPGSAQAASPDRSERRTSAVWSSSWARVRKSSVSFTDWP